MRISAWTAIAATVLLSACGGDPGVDIPEQRWQDVIVGIQVRPPTPQAGMNEFLVIASDAHQLTKPVTDMIVSVRTREDARWRQAIQDGATGVYRRALAVQDPAKQNLYVRLERDGKETVLTFPLIPEGSQSPTG